MKLRQKTPRTKFQYGYNKSYPLYIYEWNTLWDYNRRNGVDIKSREINPLINFLSECLKNPNEYKRKELTGIAFERGKGHLPCWNIHQENKCYFSIFGQYSDNNPWRGTHNPSAILTLRQAKSLMKFLKKINKGKLCQTKNN